MRFRETHLDPSVYFCLEALVLAPLDHEVQLQLPLSVQLQLPLSGDAITPCPFQALLVHARHVDRPTVLQEAARPRLLALLVYVFQ